jgi:hypothetical protein
MAVSNQTPAPETEPVDDAGFLLHTFHGGTNRSLQSNRTDLQIHLVNLP